MEIELKNFYYNEALSLASLAFTADLHIKGQYVGRCGNDGLGTPTDVEGTDANAASLIRDARQYFADQPTEVTPDGLIYQPSLTEEINKIAQGTKAQLQQEHTPADEFNFIIKRFENNAILFGHPEGKIRVVGIRRVDEGSVMAPDFLPVIADLLKEFVLPKLEPGDRVFNTNIPADVFKAAGLRPDQYTLPDPSARQKRDQSKGKGL